MSNTITIRIPEDLRAQLEEISREENLPLSDLVREALRRIISIRQFTRLRKRILPFAEAQGFLTDDDIFREIS
jgi:predicted transcriptional regulator